MKQHGIILMYIIAGISILGFLFPGCRNETPQDLNSFEGIRLPGHLTSDIAALLVTGKIKKTNPAYFDLNTLVKFPPVTFELKDSWKETTLQYTGTSLKDVLHFLEIEDSATALDVVASNDYKVSIKIEDIKRYEYILSYKLNGKLYEEHEAHMNKGPLAIAINFDKHPELDYEIYKHQLVWYVKTIIVR